MSKILDATCSPASVVTAEGVTVPAATILSQGKAQSSGTLVLDGEKAWYVTSNASDIKDLITRLVAIINQVATVATGLDAVTNAPGGQAAAIASLTLLKTQLDATKDLLK